MKNLFQIIYFITVGTAMFFSAMFGTTSVLFFGMLSLLVFIFSKIKFKKNIKMQWILQLLVLIIFVMYTKYPKEFSSCGDLPPDANGQCERYSCNGIISFGIGYIDCIFGNLKRIN